MLDKQTMIDPARALPGRSEALRVSPHFVNGEALQADDGALRVPDGAEQAMFGLGCFWGAERKFWQVEGVLFTAVGYAAGYTPNASYEEVCSGLTGHNEVVAVVYDPVQVSYRSLLAIFWQSHDPTQGMRQGNDRGTQYRSGIYTYDATQQAEAERSRDQYQQQLERVGRGQITTEIITAPPFYFAEDYHQQYLAKNPGGYCGLGGTGVAFE